MPNVNFKWVHKSEIETEIETIEIPVYLNTQRTNLITSVNIPTHGVPKYVWYQRGVALFEWGTQWGTTIWEQKTQINKDEYSKWQQEELAHQGYEKYRERNWGKWFVQEEKQESDPSDIYAGKGVKWLLITAIFITS